MTNDTPRPRDNAADFDDPAELARHHACLTDFYFDQIGVFPFGCKRAHAERQFEYHDKLACYYRALAARGEKVSRF